MKDYNKSYDFYLPEFDYQNDQLIMDFRDSGKSFEKGYSPAQNFPWLTLSIQMVYPSLNWTSLHVSKELAKNSIFMNLIHLTRNESTNTDSQFV